MSVVSSVVYRTFRAIDPGTGLGVTGLVSADFVTAAYGRPYAGAWATYDADISFDELADGWYGIEFTNPAVAGYRLISLKAADPNAVKLSHSGWDGEVMTKDLASVLAAVARPQVVLAASGNVGQKVPLSLPVSRWFQKTYAFTDQFGDPILLDSDYENFRISVRAKVQSDVSASWDADDAIEVDDDGTLTLTIPEDASFFGALPTPTALSVDSLALVYEIVADKLDVEKTVPLVVSSPLILTRSEVGT